MTEEEITTTEESEVKEEPTEEARPKRTGVGASLVGPVGIILMSAYLILTAIFLLYGLVQFWPPSTTGSASSPVTFLFWTLSISDEVRLIIIVAMAGALGSLVHALRSLYWYVGNRELVMSWLLMYILLPFVGATLALVFYFVIRGGFFSPEATIEQTSPFGFAGLGALVGMFSEQAVLKLKEVAETLLSKPHPGEDAVPQEERREEDTDFN